MPIKPENRARYPKNWKAIRTEVLERAGHRCEWEGCGVPHGEWGLRSLDGKWYSWQEFADGNIPEGVRFEQDRKAERMGFPIVLTIAHLDHEPENNGEPGNRPNLRAWCQYHHLAYDRPHHLANGRKTREAKKGQINLLVETQYPAPMEAQHG
jgi:hypothetical protein